MTEARRRAAQKLADLLDAAQGGFGADFLDGDWERSMNSWLGGDVGYWASVVSKPDAGRILIALLRDGPDLPELDQLARAFLGELAVGPTASTPPPGWTSGGDAPHTVVEHGLLYVHRDGVTVSRLDAETPPTLPRPDHDICQALLRYVVDTFGAARGTGSSQR